MDITFVTPRRLSKRLATKLEKQFGFEITLDCDDDGDFEYFFGYPQENVGEDGCCEEDPMPYDEAVRCCGILWKNGITQFGIEGNGGWAMGMIMGTDFTGFAVSDETKKEWVRVAAIFWSEANPKRLTELDPKLLVHENFKVAHYHKSL